MLLSNVERDMYAGERLFILGTGPSLHAEDLSPLACEFTWGTGHLLDWDGLGFVPEFYGCGELNTCLDLKARLEPTGMSLWYVESHQVSRSGHRPDVVWSELGLAPERWNVLHAIMKDRTDEDWPSFRIPVGIHEGEFHGLGDLLEYVGFGFKASLLHSALQPALWLGFNPIYLLGFDLTPKGYVHDAEKSRRVVNPSDPYTDRERTALAVTLARTYAAGRTVVNLSQGTRDDVLPKARLADVLKEAAWVP